MRWLKNIYEEKKQKNLKHNACAKEAHMKDLHRKEI